MEELATNKLGQLYSRQKTDAFSDIRSCAWTQFEELSWPTRKHEEYKFTPVDQILKKEFDFEGVQNDFDPSKENVSEHFYDVQGHHLVFVNGVYREDLSNLSEMEILITGFSDSDAEEVRKIVSNVSDEQSSVLFNKSFLSNGLIIRAEQATPLLPIFIYHFRGGSTNSVSCPFIHVSADSNAHLRIYERTYSVGEAQNLSSHLTSISVAKHGSVRYTKIQDHKTTDFTLDNLFVDQEEESHFYANTYSISGGLIRNNLEIAINGEHAEANMYGLYLLNGQSHVDNHTVVDHRFPNCDSNELYKGIVDDKATGVFNGKIFVRQPAQKTNAFQANNNIALSDTAVIHTKPQLEIWADDVKCSHGCTVGQLDEEALFYLQSRGIRPQAAKAMLLNAFAKETLKHVHLDVINDEITQLIHDRLDV